MGTSGTEGVAGSPAVEAVGSAGRRSGGRSCRPVLLALSVLLALVNVPLLGMAWEDRGYGAVFIALFVGPGANGIVALLGLGFTPWTVRLTGCSKTAHACLSLALPAAAIVVDFLAILAMRPHAC